MFGFWKRYLPRGFKQRAMVSWYDALARMNTGDDLLFLNHGYAESAQAPNTLELPADLERHRYPIQLYDLLVRSKEWHGKDGLEVSCGLGGGIMYVDRRYAPRSMTGLDISAASIAACRGKYRFQKPNMYSAYSELPRPCPSSLLRPPRTVNKRGIANCNKPI